MIFGSELVNQAEGAILAHSVTLPKGRIRKGVTLSAGHIRQLQNAGVAEVTVARLEAGDVHENDAAARLATALVPDPEAVSLRLSNPATGRVNLFATAPGVAQIAADRINAANAIDPMITVATVPSWQRMDKGGMVATVKIISYGVAEDTLAQACAAGQGGLALRTPVFRTADLIQTSVADESGDKGHAVIGARVSALNVALGGKMVVPHQIVPLRDALAAAKGEVLFILTGSATSDPADVAPQALREAGGSVIHFGMPVDPGNLLFIGTLGDKPVIGLPGCARSPALNGADWVLERVICGIPVTSTDIMAMGVGGLLKEIPTRPQPRHKIDGR